jgi:hypothetical protein
MTDPPHLVRTILREEHSDGHVVETEYAPIASRTDDDPYVVNRLAPTDGSRLELITEFAPAPERPPTYPASLPFIPDRPVFTTEPASGDALTGARWFCSDPDTLLAAVVQASIDDGWREIARPPKAQSLGDPQVVLERDSLRRELQNFPVEAIYVLQLWDLPSNLFSARPV